MKNLKLCSVIFSMIFPLPGHDSLEKLQNCGAFERDGETNVFARTSRSIANILAKHRITTRNTKITAMVFVSTQLSDRQQKHKRFLQSLVLSR